LGTILLILLPVKSTYGGPDEFKLFVKAAHEQGYRCHPRCPFYNHLGPGDLDLWQFDGWSENEKGAFNFYNNHARKHPGARLARLWQGVKCANLYGITL